MIFRNDDVTNNSDPFHLDRIHGVITSNFPKAEQWMCVTMFSQQNDNGSVYDNPPFKDKPVQWFYDVDQVVDNIVPPDNAMVVSHGTWHIDHSAVCYELQEASIVTSCNYLETDIFVPPFNRHNDDTEAICEAHNIELAKFSDGWKSLEHEVFDPKHELWYFHSWLWTPEKLEAKLNERSS